MRTLIAGFGLTVAGIGLLAGAAEAQIAGRGAGYPMPGRGAMVRPGAAHVMPGRPNMVPGQRWNGGGQRWQSRGGRWIGGWNAPGGWNGYRRPYVGWGLPSYWVQPGFVIGNWGGYGLAQPPVGYSWSRYYDDAVLIDGRGSVYDTVGGIDWDRYDDGAAYDARDDYAYDDRVPVAPDRRPDSGLGGAAIGAVAGGVAGNLIAGRGNRLGGTLIGAGVGGLAGYAIDKAEDRGRAPPPPRYGAGYPGPGYPVPGYPGRAYPGPGYPPHHGPGGWTSPDGRTVVTTGGDYYGGGTTTVVVQSAPVVTTTTTTEYYDDVVTYAPARRVAKRKVWRRPSKTICRC